MYQLLFKLSFKFNQLLKNIIYYIINMPFSKKQKTFVNNWLSSFPNFEMSLNKSICDEIQLGTLNILGREIDIECLDNNPGIFRFTNLLTPDECKHFINLGKDRLQRSGAATADSAYHESRTSSSAFLNRSEDHIVEALENRIARLLNIRPMQLEPVQVLHYQEGQKYDYHTDWFDPTLAHENKEIGDNMGGQREYTVLIYLNDVEGADETGNGSTCFQQGNDGGGLCAVPKIGSGVFWKNVENGEITHNTYHSGTPPINGAIKNALNIWTRQKNFAY